MSNQTIENGAAEAVVVNKAPKAPKRRKKITQDKINQVSDATNFWLNVLFVLLAAICVIPFLLVIAISLTDELTLLQSGYHFIPKKFSTEAYEFLIKNPAVVLKAYGVTLFSTVVGTTVNVVCMAMFAYPLSRSDFPYKKFFNIYVLITLLISGGLVPSYLVNVNILHLRNKIWALILPMLGGGFHIFIMRTYFKGTIADGIIEAAKIDGASEIRTFFQIVLPLAVPVIAAIALFNVFAFWNNWTNSLYYITNPDLYSLQYVMQQSLRNLQFMQQQAARGAAGIQLTQSMVLPQESVRMAMVIVGIGPIIIAYPFFQKYFISGLTIGAIKG